MKAIAVYPGMPHSMHLEEVPMPAVTDIPDGRGVLVDRAPHERETLAYLRHEVGMKPVGRLHDVRVGVVHRSRCVDHVLRSRPPGAILGELPSVSCSGNVNPPRLPCPAWALASPSSAAAVINGHPPS